jgi:hypothetical protein
MQREEKMGEEGGGFCIICILALGPGRPGMVDTTPGI